MLDSGYAFVAAPSGLLVSFGAKKGWAGKKSLKGLPKNGFVERKDPVSDRDVVIFTAPVKTGGWTFAAVAPKDEILASVHQLRTTLILIGLVALLLIAGALVWVAARIARPVREVAEAAERIAEGDLAVELAAGGNDEVGRMSAAFTSMVGSLRSQADVARRSPVAISAAAPSRALIATRSAWRCATWATSCARWSARCPGPPGR